MRWAMASCWRTSCGESWGESSPPGPSRGCRAPGGGGGGGGTWPVRRGGLWWRGPWGEGCCCGGGGCWDGCEGACGSPDPGLRRGLPAPRWPSWARLARWGGGLWPSTQKSAMLSLSTGKEKEWSVQSVEQLPRCIAAETLWKLLTFDVSGISSRPHLLQVIYCSTRKQTERSHQTGSSYADNIYDKTPISVTIILFHSSVSYNVYSAEVKLADLVSKSLQTTFFKYWSAWLHCSV